VTARSSRFRQRRSGDAAAGVAQQLTAADRFPADDPRRAARQRGAARVVAADPGIADSPLLRRWRSDLLLWMQFVPYLASDDVEEQLRREGRAAISAALTELAVLDGSPRTALNSAEHGVRLLESQDPAARASADAEISAVTAYRSAPMTAVLQRLTASHAADDAARGIDNWRLRFALSQQTTTATLDHLLEAVSKRIGTAQEWYAHRGALVGSRYADRRVGPAIATVSLAADAQLVAAAYADAVPEIRAEAERAAARIRPGTTNEVVFEADGRLSATVDHRPTARGRLMVAHELGHAVHALRARSDRAPGALVGETIACLTALMAGLSVRRTAPSDRVASSLALGDMIVEELFVSALVCRFEDEIQRVVRAGGTLHSDHLDQCWYELHRQQFGATTDVPSLVGSQWARLSSLAMQPGHAVSYVWATVLSLAIRSRWSTAGSFDCGPLVCAIDRGAMPADDLPEMLGFAGDSWILAGLDALDDLLAQLRTVPVSS
jgi:hypothetical protein